MSNNIRLLPKWMPDEECRELVAWIDSLEIGEVKNLKTIYERHEKLQQENEQLKLAIQIQNDDFVTYNKEIEKLHEAGKGLCEAFTELINLVPFNTREPDYLINAKEALAAHGKVFE